MKNLPLNLVPTTGAESNQSFYRALCSRDGRFDGSFFAGVKTTGIYCRPVCKVRKPKFTSCIFFRTAAEAEAAGFRPCLRCRPELAPYDFQPHLAHAIWKKIADGALNQKSIDAFAIEIGLSARQIRRIIQTEFGVSPVAIAQTHRLLLAKQLLHESNLSIAQIAYSAGFGSVRRLNTLFQDRYQLNPSEFRRQHSAADGLRLRLSYRPPFNWIQTLDYLRGRQLHGVEKIEQKGGQWFYACAVRIDHYAGWICVRNLDPASALEVEISPQLYPVLQTILVRLRYLFDLQANPARIFEDLANHPELRTLLQSYPGTRVPGAFDVFELGIRAILGQQVSVAGATTVTARLIQTFGDEAVCGIEGLRNFFPRPEQLANIPIEQLAKIGIPKTRAQTLQNFACFALSHDLNNLRGLPIEQLLPKLQNIPGIGPWTANYIAMRGLSEPRAFPAGDLGLIKAYRALLQTEQAISMKQLEQVSTNWLPWRGYVAMLLWRSLAT